MRTAILMLCAVVAEAAPFAAKSVTSAEPELPAVVSPAGEITEGATSPGLPLEEESPISAADKVTKSKKFQPSELDLFDGKKHLTATAKLDATTTAPTPETSMHISEVTTAPLAATENTSLPSERETELLKSHISPPFVQTALFEDEKASRYEHSALFGYSSFF